MNDIMVLNGFVDEDRLDELFLDKEISCVDYVKHHSQEMNDAYMAFLRDNNLQDSEAAASRFLDEENLSMARKIEQMDELGTASDNIGAVAVYNQWKLDGEKLNDLIAESEVASKVTLWRYNNPTSSKQALCATQTEEHEEDVKKWWGTIDFVNGSLGGGHMRLVEPTIDNVKTIIVDAALQASMG